MRTASFASSSCTKLRSLVIYKQPLGLGGASASSNRRWQRPLQDRVAAAAAPKMTTDAAPAAALSVTPEMMAGFMTRIAECNTGLKHMSELTPFQLDGVTIGYVKQE